VAGLELTRLMNNARVHLPGALDTALQYELFNVLNDFFQDTNIWKEDITFGVTALDPAPTTIYYIEQSSVSSINRLLGVVNDSGLPVNAAMATPGELTLQLPPGNTATWTATVALTVDDPVAASGSNAGFPEFPVWVLNKYNTGILSGVVSRMMAQPAKPYTNPALSLQHHKIYAKAVRTARGEALHGNLNNGQNWRFPSAFSTTRRH
jgi:hypothetical protein